MKIPYLALLYLVLLFAPFACLAAEEYEIDVIPLGDTEVTAITDAHTSMEASLLPELQKYPQFQGVFQHGPAPAVAKTYLFKTGPHLALVDAGWGDEQKIMGCTLEALKASGIDPGQITDVLLTHLDMDHIGGLTQNGQAVYPNATLHVAEPEWQAWQAGAIQKRPQAAIERARALAKIYNGRIKLFKHGDEVLPAVRAVDASGHTPGHTAFDLVSGNDKLTIGGDIIHIYQVQLPMPDLSTVYDIDPKKAAESRKFVLNRAAEENAQLAGMHFPMISNVIKRQDGGFAMREAR